MSKFSPWAGNSPAPIYDTLILSDLHLGSELSRAEEALAMLKGTIFRRLILLGDIFCDLNFARLTRKHWDFLSYVRKLSNPKRRVEVVWVEGNHDRGLSEVMSHLVGVRVFDEYTWTFSGRRFLAVHGHQFDRFLVNNAALSALGAFFYMHLQRFDSRGHALARFLDRRTSAWLRLSPKVESGAVAYARLQGADVVFCGHTHVACESARDGVHYLNSGSWTNPVPSYITVDASGARLHEYLRHDTREFAAAANQ